MLAPCIVQTPKNEHPALLFVDFSESTLISAPKGAECSPDLLTNPSNGAGLPEVGGAPWKAQPSASLAAHLRHSRPKGYAKAV